MTHHLNIDALVLQKGAHDSPDDGMCVMEAAAYFAGEKFSDHPKCVSPVIGAFLRCWNDDLDDDGRQMLKPYVAKVVGTAGDKDTDEMRAWMVTDWMVRVHMPAWLEVGGMSEQAAAVRALPELVDAASWSKAKATVVDARDKAAAAGDAAWAAARDAARAAAWDAARDAAWDAARDAARAAAGDAAWAAARDAAGDAAWAAARDAARAAAWDAAWAAAKTKKDKYDAVYNAVYATGKAKLDPVVPPLQQAALELLDRLIAVRAEATVA